MKKAIFNIITYSMLIWSILCAVYTALPSEYQIIPEFTWLTALISGGSTALLGSGGLIVNSFLNKTKTSTNDKFTLAIDKVSEIKKNYESLENKYVELMNKYVEILAETKRNNQLLETDLEIKASNPLIDDASKKLIDKILGKEEVDLND